MARMFDVRCLMFDLNSCVARDKLSSYIVDRTSNVPSLPAEKARLPHLVSTSFQVLFHSARSGSFHLSLAVLVHYRSPMSI